MQLVTVCFFGHREIDRFEQVSEWVEKVIDRLFHRYACIDFLIGRDGDFDRIVSSAIVRAQRAYGKERGHHILVLPYLRAEYRDNMAGFETYYDEIEICEKSAYAYPKGAITIRNQFMVDRSDVCVFYVERESGGAWRTLRYAIRKHKTVINLAKTEKTETV